MHRDVCECAPLMTLKEREKKMLPVKGSDSWKAPLRCLCHACLSGCTCYWDLVKKKLVKRKPFYMITTLCQQQYYCCQLVQFPQEWVVYRYLTTKLLDCPAHFYFLCDRFQSQVAIQISLYIVGSQFPQHKANSRCKEIYNRLFFLLLLIVSAAGSWWVDCMAPKPCCKRRGGGEGCC